MAIKPKSKSDEGEYGYEGDMAMSQLRSIIRNSQAILDKLEPTTDLPEWVQSKITLAEDYISTAANYLHSELEEAVSVATKHGLSSGVSIKKPIQRIPQVNTDKVGVHQHVIQKEQANESNTGEKVAPERLPKKPSDKAKVAARRVITAKKEVNKINTKPAIETQSNGDASTIQASDTDHNTSVKVN